MLLVILFKCIVIYKKCSNKEFQVIHNNTLFNHIYSDKLEFFQSW